MEQEITKSDAYKLLHQGSLALAEAEMQGIRIDLDYIKQKKQELTERIEQTEKQLKQSKFWKQWKDSRDGEEPNYNSNPQIQTFLYKVKGYTPPKYTDSGKKELDEAGETFKGSTDEEALKELNVEELDLILQIRKLKKIRDVYLENFEKETVNNYIHPFYNLHTARSYRSSSSRPNWQNIPSRDKEAMQITRGAIFPRPGHQLLEVDFKSLEVAIGACLHKDPMMLSYLKEGGDMHKDVADQIFIKDVDLTTDWGSFIRKATKNSFVFPQFYGDYYKNNAISVCQWMGLPRKKFRKGQGIELDESYLSDHFIAKGIKSFEDLVQHIKEIEEDFWSNRFPTYAQWKDDIWEFYKEHGYVDMPTGFRCSGVMRKNEINNILIQGSAFHCLLWSFIQITDKLKDYDTKLVGQIHDSIIADTNPNELDDILPIIKKITTEQLPENWKWIIVPLNVDAEITPVDGSWAEKEEIKII